MVTFDFPRWRKLGLCLVLGEFKRRKIKRKNTRKGGK